MVFIVIGIIFTVVMAFGSAAITYLGVIDLAPIINDPEVLAFIAAYPAFIPVLIGILAGLQVIYLAIIYMWRKDPMAHRNGLTIVGIFNLFTGWSLPGLFIILPGLLMEEQQ